MLLYVVRSMVEDILLDEVIVLGGVSGKYKHSMPRPSFLPSPPTTPSRLRESEVEEVQKLTFVDRRNSRNSRRKI